MRSPQLGQKLSLWQESTETNAGDLLVLQFHYMLQLLSHACIVILAYCCITLLNQITTEYQNLSVSKFGIKTLNPPATSDHLNSQELAVRTGNS